MAGQYGGSIPPSSAHPHVALEGKPNSSHQALLQHLLLKEQMRQQKLLVTGNDQSFNTTIILDIFNDICILTVVKSRRVGEKSIDYFFPTLVILLEFVSLKEFCDYRKEKMITSSHSFAAAELPSMARHVVHVPLHQC